MTRPNYLSALRFLADLWTPNLLIPVNMRDNLDCGLPCTDAAWFRAEAVRLAKVMR